MGLVETLTLLLVSSLAPSLISALVGVSMNMLYSVTRTINLAHGSFMVIGAYVTYYLIVSSGVDLLAAIPLAFFFNAVLGIGLYLGLRLSGLFKRAETEIEGITTMITFGITLLIEGLVSQIMGSTRKAIPTSVGSLPLIGSVSIRTTDLLTIAVSFVAIILTYWYFMSSKTKIGRETKCVIQDMNLAKLVGLDTDRIGILNTCASIGLTGIAGSLYSLYYAFDPFFGLIYTLIAFISTAVAGIGNYGTTLLLALGIFFVQSLLGFSVTYGAAIAIVYVLLVALLVIRPLGIRRGLR